MQFYICTVSGGSIYKLAEAALTNLEAQGVPKEILGLCRSSAAAIAGK